MTEHVRFTYRAFLSYSHRDKAWAEWLHGALESYRIDDHLVGRETPAGPVPKTLAPIFRDRDDFAAGHSLTEQTLAALSASRFLVVICSPNAAKSEYVNEEIRRFKDMGRAERVIAIIVDGEPGDPQRECFPPALRFKLGPDGALTDEREEPIAADARHVGDGKRLALQKVVAGLLGVSFDDVRKRDAIADNFRIKVAAAAAAVFAVAVMAGGYFYWHAEEQDKNTRSLVIQLAEVKALVERGSPGVPGAEKKAQELVTAAAEDDRLRRALELLKANKKAEAEALFRAVAEEKAARIRQDSKEAAAAYRNLGAIAGLGDPKRALDAYLKAVELDPNDIDSLFWAGWIQIQRGYLNESEQHLRRIISMAKDAYVWHAYWARLAMGDIRAARGDLGAAMAEYKNAEAIASRLAKADPGDRAWQRDLSASYNKIGDVLVAQGNLAAALTAYRDSLAIAEHLAQVDPNNAGWQRDLSVSYNKVGDVLVAQGNLAAALTTYRDSLAIADRLAKADPNNAGWQRDLSVTHNKVGDVLLAQGDLAAALAAYRDGLAIAERLAQSDPGNEGWQRDLSVSHHKIGNVFKAQANPPAALSAFRDSLAITERLAKSDPGNMEWQRDLAVDHETVGDILAVQGNLPAALTAYRDSLAIRQRLAQSDSGNVQWQVDVLWMEWRLAVHGDDPARRWGLIVNTLRKLKAEDKLTVEQAKWLPEAERRLELAKK